MNKLNKLSVDPSYSTDVLDKWRMGADRFKRFWRLCNGQPQHPFLNKIWPLKTRDDASKILRQQHAFGRDPQEIIGEMQAMFLGEKPAIFSDSFIKSHFGNQLKNFGFIIDGDWIYDPKQIQALIDDYQDIMPEDLKSPKDAIDFLNKGEKSDHHLIRGLFLGYPFSSSAEFSYRSREKLSIADGVIADTYGNHWSDYGEPEKDSIKRATRLRDAFEQSGILDENYL